jgi:hypothetical protein
MLAKLVGFAAGILGRHDICPLWASALAYILPAIRKQPSPDGAHLWSSLMRQDLPEFATMLPTGAFLGWRVRCDLQSSVCCSALERRHSVNRLRHLPQALTVWKIIVHPPQSSIGVNPPGTPMAQNEYPHLQMLPIEAATRIHER